MPTAFWVLLVLFTALNTTHALARDLNIPVHLIVTFQPNTSVDAITQLGTQIKSNSNTVCLDHYLGAKKEDLMPYAHSKRS